MARFDRVYEPDQIEAFLHAYLDRKIRPMRKVCDMARHGQLLTRDGRETRPFDPNQHTFAGYVARERRRRRGAPRGSALDRPDDVLEGLRKRMIAVADQELTHAERQKRGKRDPEHLRQIARLVREVAALPKPGEGRAVTPGAKANGERHGSATQGGIAASLLAAHRRTPTAPEHPTQTQRKAENAAQRSEAQAPTPRTDRTTRTRPAQSSRSPVSRGAVPEPTQSTDA